MPVRFRPRAPQPYLRLLIPSAPHTDRLHDPSLRRLQIRFFVNPMIMVLRAGIFLTYDYRRLTRVNAFWWVKVLREGYNIAVIHGARPCVLDKH